MQSNALKKTVEATPLARIANDNARRIMARARYQAPSVASYAISGVEQSGQVSMLGNQGGGGGGPVTINVTIEG